MGKTKSLDRELRAWLRPNPRRVLKIEFDSAENKFNAIGLEPQAGGGSKILAMAKARTPDAAMRKMIQNHAAQ